MGLKKMLNFIKNNSRDAIRARENNDFRNSFISSNRKFIMSKAYSVTGHYITENDDEYSIALIAFNEAIDSYDESKGDFFALAGLIIKRRLIDYLKLEAKHKAVIYTDTIGKEEADSDEDGELALQLEVRAKEAEMSQSAEGMKPGSNAIQDEISALSEVLHDYGFSFFDLVDCSPKAEKTKTACGTAVNYLFEDADLLKKMRSNKTLPIKEIVENTDVPRKILERHRKYIIAAVEILAGDYPLVSEYMGYIRKGR